jgi:aminopeptidase-like protein
MDRVNFNEKTAGEEMHLWASDLFPLNRSLTGHGTDETLGYLKSLVPALEIKSIPTGSQVFDWVVPRVWNIQEGFIKNFQGEKLIDFSNSNLHIMGYSTAVHAVMNRDELAEHVYVLPEQSNAIPYVTSYYKDAWGFCMTSDQWEDFGDGPFEVFIDSEKVDGNLNYAEILIPGTSNQEVLFSTYVCHPSMANNELSGPVVLVKLIQNILNMPDRQYSYRAVFLPETIGSLVFLSKNLHQLKRNLVAGWVLTCLGDDERFSFIPSRLGNSYADKITLELLNSKYADFKKFTWLDRGSDERQYCAPGIDLPVCSVTKSKYGEYAQYHTSLDDLSFITPNGLEQSLNFYKEIVEILEENSTPKILTLGEPQLGKRNLYPDTSTKNNKSTENLMNVISYLDGQHNLSEIAHLCAIQKAEVDEIINILRANHLISET